MIERALTGHKLESRKFDYRSNERGQIKIKMDSFCVAAGLCKIQIPKNLQDLFIENQFFKY